MRYSRVSYAGGSFSISASILLPSRLARAAAISSLTAMYAPSSR